MKPEQLKASILQYAIQGKLVEQRPEEGTAEELYKKILADKNVRLNGKKEGKLSSEKFKDDEIPYDIPDTWKWVRFGQIMINRDAERIPLSVSERQNLEKKYDYYGASGVIDKVDRYLFDETLLLIGEDGANLLSRSTPIAYLAKGQYWVNNHAHVLDCNRQLLCLEYIMYFINAISLAPYVTGTAQPKMNQEKMNSIPIALPPLAEQQRIVAKIEELLPFVDRYATSYEKLEQFNAKFPEDMKKSILQYAIQGKLVEQRPEEGTSEELYQQIQQEKQKIEKKSKKSVTTDAFLDDEILFDIPETWKWVHLKDIMSVYGGKRIPAGKKLTKENTGHIYIRVSDMKDGSVMDTDIHYVPEDIYPIIKNYTISKDDVYITVAGTIGRVGIIPEKFDNANLTENADKLIIYSLNKEYVMYLMSSPIIQRQIIEATTKVGQPKLAIKRIEDMAIPLPPLKEQERIVAKIKELMPYCDWLVK